MPGFGDSAFLVLLALLLFGPKKLPVLARQLGKLMADFRRASNEFRTQMEEELRISEQSDRQKQIAAIEAPPTPAVDGASPALEAEADYPYHGGADSMPTSSPELPLASSPDSPVATLPIATSGKLSILPPSTGLPVANSSQYSDTEAVPAAPVADSVLQAHAETDDVAAVPVESAEHTTVSDHQAELETEIMHG